jgi:hypothetical protein
MSTAVLLIDDSDGDIRLTGEPPCDRAFNASDASDAERERPAEVR